MHVPTAGAQIVTARWFLGIASGGADQSSRRQLKSEHWRKAQGLKTPPRVVLPAAPDIVVLRDSAGLAGCYGSLPSFLKSRIIAG